MSSSSSSPALRPKEPAEVERPQVATRQLGPHRDQRREVTFALDPVAAFLVLGHEREDDLARLLADEGAVAAAVGLGGRGVEQARRQTQLQDVGAPVGEVEERVEVLLHPRVLVALEAAPGVVVDEARRRDARPRRVRPQLAHLLRRERPVDRLELVVLVLAHGFVPPRRRLACRSGASARALRCSGVAVLRATASILSRP